MATLGTWTHLRLRISPDGGISRLRVMGTPDGAAPGAHDPLLQRLNEADEVEAIALFTTCCGARRWAAGMEAARPFRSRTELHGVAEDLWWHLDEGDWREAFTHHPQIGADVEQLRKKFAGTGHLSASEQAGVAGASEETLQALAKGNQLYLDTYGFIFIVCASASRPTRCCSCSRSASATPPPRSCAWRRGSRRRSRRCGWRGSPPA